MTADTKTLIRRITDYLHKYATPDQVKEIAIRLPIKLDAKVERGLK